MRVKQVSEVRQPAIRLPQPFAREGGPGTGAEKSLTQDARVVGAERAIDPAVSRSTDVVRAIARLSFYRGGIP